jgi:hypothetical protein
MADGRRVAGVALLIMVFGLNINGYMSPDSPIYIDLLNSRNPGYVEQI